jgi:hypothetical protein
MAGWFEYSLFLGASKVLTAILKKLKFKYYDNGVTIEMIVEITRRASQAHTQRFLPCKKFKNYLKVSFGS